MTEHPLADIARYEAPAIMYRLVGLTCAGYGSVASRTERTEQSTPDSYGVVYLYAGSGWVETVATVGRIAVEAGKHPHQDGVKPAG